MDERNAYIGLNLMQKIGPVGVRLLASALGSVSAIFSATRQEIMQAHGVGRELAKVILERRDEVDPEEELDKASGMGARIVTQIDEEYPRSLLEIHDPPLALYIMGALQSRDAHAFAIVGTRRPTHYGREATERIASQLACAGYTVVSGLAEGIDTVAHRAALKLQGRTLAVLGGALDRLYPRTNAGLAGEIAENGAVMTEFPFGRQPDKTTFPMRNRIVSGLSLGVVVVEAGSRSGALITAGQALDQGRSVFAVPGRIDSYASQGCNALIRDGASLVRGVEDVLSEYEFLMKPSVGRNSEAARPRANLTDDEVRLAEILEEGEQDVDSLIRASGLAPSSVGSLLLSLEMKRVVRMLPGRIVELIGGKLY